VALTYSLVAQGTHGTTVVDPDGTFTYTPQSDFEGTDRFTFKANDGLADSNTATISITVSAVNDPPVNSVPNAHKTDEDTPLPIGGVAVADSNGDRLTIMLIVVSGILTVNQRQRQLGGDHCGRRNNDQYAPAQPVISGQTRLQRARYTKGRELRWRSVGHRHGPDHRQPGERRAAQHRAWHICRRSSAHSDSRPDS
jgi:VCBS repeat-containing protein